MADHVGFPVGGGLFIKGGDFLGEIGECLFTSGRVVSSTGFVDLFLFVEDVSGSGASVGGSQECRIQN